MRRPGSSLDVEAARLRDVVLRVLGATTMAATGCGPVLPVEDGVASGGSRTSGTTDDSTSSTGTPATSTSVPTTTESATASTDGDVPRFDLGVPDSPGPVTWCEAVSLNWGARPTAEYLCPLARSPEPDHYACLPIPDEGCAAIDLECLHDQWERSLCPDRGVEIDLSCDFDPGQADACCWMVELSAPSYGCPTPGRPFTVDGAARTARLRPGHGWAQGPRPDVGDLDDATRESLRDAWRREALAEHAAVAAFARFTLELLAVGAPADLVASAQTATAEELLHARRFMAFANTYGGVELEPGVLDISGGLAHEVDRIAIAVAVAGEACIAETAAALQMCVARDRARDPAVAAVLAEIAEQEIRHALLGWRYLAWALRDGHPIRGVLTATFARAAELLSPPFELAPGVDEAAHADHGRLPPSELRVIARAAVRDVIAPAAAALLYVEPRAPIRATTPA